MSRCWLLPLLFVVCMSVGCRTPPVPVPEATGWPVILIHGFGGSKESPVMGQYFRGVEEMLVADRVRVFIPTLPRYASSASRATFLKESVDKALVETGASRVHLIAHSQGGLDARYLIEKLGYANKIGSLTTFSTPHHGTPIAQLFDPLPDPVLDLALSLVNFGATDGAGGVRSLSTDLAAPKGEHAYPVPAFSFAGLAGQDLQAACDDGLWGKPAHVVAPQAWLMPTWSFIGASGDGVVRANDGLVPVDSAHWQNFLGCIPADHVALIGLGGLAPEGDAPPFNPGLFIRDYVRALRPLEAGAKASVVVASPPPSVARLLH